MNKTINQFIKFCIVGFTNVLVDFSFLNLFHLLLHLNIYLSATLSFLIAGFNSFYWNRRWTFRATDPQKAKTQFIQFLLINTIGLGINNLIMYLFIDKLFLNYNLAKLIATIIVVFYNFTANKLWTFKSTISLSDKE